MKKLLKFFLSIGLSVIAVTAALGGGPVFGPYSFDENGNGMGPGGPIPGVIGIDPLTGQPALVYALPFAPAPGDVLLTESGAGSNVVSDVFRFFQNNLIVYSEREPGETNFDLADVLVFPPLQPNVAGAFAEVGPEGSNGFVWLPAPGSGAPGDVGVPVQYNFISDVPEPATVTLVGLSLVGLWAINRRRK
jgi:hypothetical protein